MLNNKLLRNYRQRRFSSTVWRYVFVADLKALSCQVIQKFIKCRNAKTRTISAIEATRCYGHVLLYVLF